MLHDRRASPYYGPKGQGCNDSQYEKGDKQAIEAASSSSGPALQLLSVPQSKKSRVVTSASSWCTRLTTTTPRNCIGCNKTKRKRESDTGPGWMGPLGCIGGSGHPLCDTIWSNVFTLAGFAGQYVDLREYFKAATINIGAITMR